MQAPSCTFLGHSQPRDCGDYLHRIHWPAQALGELTHCTAIQMTHPDVLRIISTTDVLIICMAVDSVLFDVIALRNEFNRPTIFEISDDFQAFPKNTQMAPFYAQPSVRLRLKQLAKSCDAIQTSSPHLARKYSYLNPCSTVFMNQAWEVPTLSTRSIRDRIQIGWIASGGHVEDGFALGKLMQEALKDLDQEQFEFSAMTTEHVAKALRHHGLKVRLHPTGSFEDCLKYLQTLDIGLAHLTDDSFSQGRSDGKYIEYATQGVIAFCHNSGTFQHTISSGENGFLYDDATDFKEKIERLISDSELRVKIRSGAHNDLVQTRNHKCAAHTRLKWYSDLCTAPPSETSPAFNHCTSPIEIELMDLMEQQIEAPSKDLIRQYQRIIQKEPAAYQPWSYMGMLFKQLSITKKRSYIGKRSQQLQKKAFSLARNQLMDNT